MPLGFSSMPVNGMHVPEGLLLCLVPPPPSALVKVLRKCVRELAGRATQYAEGCARLEKDLMKQVGTRVGVCRCLARLGGSRVPSGHPPPSPLPPIHLSCVCAWV